MSGTILPLTKWTRAIGEGNAVKAALANRTPTRALMALDGDLLPSRPASSLLSGEAHAA